jgi:hypothetical protein
MKISKETFVNAVNTAKEFEDSLFSLYGLGIDVVEFCSKNDVTSTLIEVLDEVTGGGDLVSYYAYELDFGRKWKEDSFSDDNGSIDISTPEKLYEALVDLGGFDE